MKRRQFLASSALAMSAMCLTRLAIVRAASATTLKSIPYADLALLDPMVAAFVTRNQ